MSAPTRALQAIKASGQELLSLLVDDWVLFFATIAAVALAAGLAGATSGGRTAAGVTLFAGIWVGLFASLTRTVRDHRVRQARDAVKLQLLPDSEPVA
jgi:hypothetical protein